MNEQVAKKVAELLDKGTVAGFVALKEQKGHILPCLFTKPEELSALNLGDWKKPGDARYPLNQVLLMLARAHPEDSFAVLARGCDERGLVELFKWNQLNPDRVVTIGIACPQELADQCACTKPYPDALVAGEKVNGVTENAELRKIEAMNLGERFTYWMGQFEKCMKCYGCRNVCPMCFCNDCSLEEEALIQKAVLPTENPIFHLTRAVHMIGRCIDCGLCEEACPADIPLRTLYKKVAEIIAADTGYRTGVDKDQKSPFNLFGTT